jgi:hypothetical protein
MTKHLHSGATLRSWMLAALAAALSGCAGFIAQPGPAADPPGRYVELTLPFTAVGDTQEHESTGYPMHDNDSAVDAYVEVAQRPPEQPLFGRRILEWALQRHASDPFLHLGDVMDLSCQSESARVLRIVREAGRQGAILPGNHDGLMFGIYSYNILSASLDQDAKHWNQACRRGAQPQDARHKDARQAMSKRDFVSVYLTEQARRTADAPGLQPPPATGDVRVSWRNPDAKAFLSAVEAQLLDGFRYADSFVAQRLQLPRAPGAPRGVILIGLDTNQAGALVSTWDTLMGRSPGDMGHVRPDQIEAVSTWVQEAASAGDIVVFAGHHNWQSLGLPTRLLLRNLMTRLDHPLVYLSAHTHRGFWAVHTALDRRPLLELNVSSLSDWPIAYRRISFAYDEQAKQLRVRGDLMPNAGRTVRSDADLLAAWTDEACSQIGPEPEAFVKFDKSLVTRQRDSRGSLFEWLYSALAPVCEACEDLTYRHAHAYQDALLEALLQLASHLGQRAHQLYNLPLPAWCGDSDFFDCARALQAQSLSNLQIDRELFRRKAVLVDLIGSHLDDLKSPQAAAYMTCRAVHAAKIDFDDTTDARRGHRGEANRKAEQYFRVDASVGMR